MLVKNKYLTFSIVFILATTATFLFLSDDRFEALSFPGLFSNTLRTPVARDYSNVLPGLPTEKVVLWLLPESIQTESGGTSITSWSDSGPNGLHFFPAPGTRPPSRVASAVKGYSSALFRDGAYLKTSLVPAKKLLLDRDFAVVMLLKPDSASSNRIYDLFGWGDCGSERFLAHLLFSSQLQFQFGDPELGAPSEEPTSPANQYNLAIFIKRQKSLSIELNGILIGQREGRVSYSPVDKEYEFKLGDSDCLNNYDGEIVEFLILSGLGDAGEVASITKHFINKYNLRF